jgi:hypothetical protein
MTGYFFLDRACLWWLDLWVMLLYSFIRQE